MSYEEMIRDTDEMIRRVMLHNEIATWLMAAVITMLIVIIGIFAILEHREKMKNLKMIRATMESRDQEIRPMYQPTFTGEVQKFNGVEYMRMGTPERSGR